jgi:sugar phosphate permease
MAIMSKTQVPELRAYAIALVLFVILHFLLTALGNSVVASGPWGETWMPYLNVLAYTLYMVAGFVAGALTRRYHVLNGMVTGFLAGAIAVLLFGVGPSFNFGTVVLLLNGAIFGGVGGACSMLLRQKDEAPNRFDSSGPAT